MSNVQKRMAELMKPIDRQIMMCDSSEDLLMFACAMLTTITTVFNNELGVEGRKRMFKDLV